MSKFPPRGYRQNNAGNIRHGQPWQGLSEYQPDPDFCAFKTPEFGIRALAKTLLTYQNKHGLRTIERIISRWAPPVENDTSAYVAAVEKATGLRKNLVLDLYKAKFMLPLVKAIVAHENGRTPKGWKHGRDWYPEAVYAEGLRLAGVK